MPGPKPEAVLAEGNFLRLARIGRWEYVERINCRDVAVVVAVDAQGRMILCEQFRVPLGAPVIEPPAGLVGDRDGNDETLEEAARRELWEETGYHAAETIVLARGPVSAGLTNETIAFVRALGLEKTGPGGGDPTENIIVHAVPLDAVEPWLKAQEAEGKWIDPKIYIGIYFARATAEEPPPKDGA